MIQKVDEVTVGCCVHPTQVPVNEYFGRGNMLLCLSLQLKIN